MTTLKHKEVENAEYTFAFEVQGEKFYIWKDLTSLPTSRKIVAGATMDLRSLRISDEKLDTVLTKIEEMLDPSSGKLQVGDARVLVREIRMRLQMLPLPELILRLAAQLFFKMDDDFEADLTPDEVDRRVELFRTVKKKVIFTPHILNLIGQTALSTAALPIQESFLRELEATQTLAHWLDSRLMGG